MIDFDHKKDDDFYTPRMAETKYEAVETPREDSLSSIYHDAETSHNQSFTSAPDTSQ